MPTNGTILFPRPIIYPMVIDMGNVIQGCWAAPLGNCGGGISHEHYVSECVFPNQSIFVQGLDFCLDKPKELRIESVTAKILCKDHNSALSELDSAAGSAFKVIRDYANMTTERDKTPYINWMPMQFTIDGPRLERWCLKTLLNFSFNRQLIIGPGTHDAGTVPGELVRIAFGIEEFMSGRGLYTAFKQKETFIFDDHFRYVAKAQGSNLAMGLFSLGGFRFYLNLLPVANRYTNIEDSQVFYRQTHFKYQLGQRFSHGLSITWGVNP